MSARGLWIDIGKRAGVTAGLLGVLCVLAELCFLFPEVLVSHDALGFYRAVGVPSRHPQRTKRAWALSERCYARRRPTGSPGA